MIIYRKQKEYSTRLGRTLAGINKTILKKPNIASKRSAVLAEKKINKVKDSINNVVLNPGETVNRYIVKPSIETPITATALNAVPIPGTSGLVGYIGKPEKAFYKKIGVDKKLKNAADKYMNTKASKYIEGVVNSAVNFGKVAMI